MRPSPAVLRALLLDTARHLGIKARDYEAWYNVDVKEFDKFDALKRLLHSAEAERKSSWTLFKLLKDAFPEHQWNPHAFSHSAVPKVGLDKQRESLLEIGAKMGIDSSNIHNWYTVTNKNFIAAGGQYLLEQFGGSLSNLLRTLIPDHSWDLSAFNTKPQKYWHSIENQRNFLTGVAKNLGYRDGDLSAWYRIKLSEIESRGGGPLLYIHGNSRRALLASVFPEHKWQFWKLHQRNSNRFWNDYPTLVDLMNYLEERLDLAHGHPEAWYRVTGNQLSQLGVSNLIRSEDDLFLLLKTTKPDFDWQRRHFRLE